MEAPHHVPLARLSWPPTPLRQLVPSWVVRQRTVLRATYTSSKWHWMRSRQGRLSCLRSLLSLSQIAPWSIKFLIKVFPSQPLPNFMSESPMDVMDVLPVSAVALSAVASVVSSISSVASLSPLSSLKLDGSPVTQHNKADAAIWNSYRNASLPHTHTFSIIENQLISII